MTVEEAPVRGIEHPHVVLSGPWTREAREHAIAEEVRIGLHRLLPQSGQVTQLVSVGRFAAGRDARAWSYAE